MSKNPLSHPGAAPDATAIESPLSDIHVTPVSADAAPCASQAQEKINLLDLDRKQMREFFIQMGEKPFRADQIMK